MYIVEGEWRGRRGQGEKGGREGGIKRKGERRGKKKGQGLNFRTRVCGIEVGYMCPFRCCYITVDSSTNALQIGACTYQCISKQMYYKTLFSHNGYMKSLEVWKSGSG